VILAAMVACATHKLPTATIHVDGHPVRVEVAADPEARARGLMYRDALPPDDGMLFVYPTEELRSFWMKDTRIALSIAYADRAGRIVHITDMRPLDLSQVPSVQPAMYALEMNQGWFDAHDVAVGDFLTKLPAPAE
jgi:hypothetical protein